MILRNWRHMIKASWLQSIFTVCIVAFLLFFLQILCVASYQIKQSSQQVQQKLGVYLYLNDDIALKDTIYADAISLMTELKQQGLRVEFYSKEQAFSLLEERLPNILDDLHSFGIENPLPPTLYVMFRTQSEYNYLKSILPQYRDVLQNLDDFQNGIEFGEQEQRISTVINMMQTVQIGAYTLIAIVIIIILAFLWYAIEINFLRFSKQIELEKLLGSPYWKIVASFLVYVASTLAASFALLGGIIWGVVSKINPYFMEMYQMSFLQATLPAAHIVWKYLFYEVIIVSLLSLFFAGMILYYLLRKV